MNESKDVGFWGMEATAGALRYLNSISLEAHDRKHKIVLSGKAKLVTNNEFLKTLVGESSDFTAYLAQNRGIVVKRVYFFGGSWRGLGSEELKLTKDNFRIRSSKKFGDDRWREVSEVEMLNDLEAGDRLMRQYAYARPSEHLVEIISGMRRNLAVSKYFG